MFLIVQVANPANFLKFFLTSGLSVYTDILSFIVKLPDEVCVSDTKRVGDLNKTVFTAQEFRKNAAHCFIPLKIFLKYSVF